MSKTEILNQFIPFAKANGHLTYEELVRLFSQAFNVAERDIYATIDHAMEYI